MSLVVLSFVMEAGESLTEGVDCSAGPIVKITMPPTWASDGKGGPAVLSFQTSSDGNGYNDVFNPDGTELVFQVIPGTGIIGMRLQTGWVKFRSGTRDQPVIQPEHRDFAIALDVPGSAPAAASSKKKGG